MLQFLRKTFAEKYGMSIILTCFTWEKGFFLSLREGFCSIRERFPRSENDLPGPETGFPAV